MKTSESCIHCQIGTILRMLKRLNLSEEELQQRFRNTLRYFAECDYSLTPPELHANAWQIVMDAAHGKDPVEADKKADNERVLALVPMVKEKIRKSDDPYLTAMKYAIAGNVIDPLPQHGVTVEQAFDAVLAKPLFVDHSARLRKELEQGAKVLYVTDNAGEIVLDRVFLETLFELGITLPQNITVAVKGLPANNDAMRADAEQAGLTKLVRVIDTGDDTMGITLSRSSEEFKDAFFSADIVIAKGMGNFESMSDYREVTLCHMLMVKCDNVSEASNVPKGEFLCMFNR